MHAEMPVGQKINAHSDHFAFFLEGVPSAWMGDAHRPSQGRGFGHTHWDTIDKVEMTQLRDASSVGARLALRIANADVFPASRRSKAAVEELLRTDPDLVDYRIAEEMKTAL
jgi:Zn-dependent M28 family amino/carboxypeptidase